METKIKDDSRQNCPIIDLPLSPYGFMFTPLGSYVKSLSLKTKHARTERHHLKSHSECTFGSYNELNVQFCRRGCWSVSVCFFQGDGLEFKRLFVKIKQKLGDIISTQKILLPITWAASASQFLVSTKKLPWKVERKPVHIELFYWYFKCVLMFSWCVFWILFSFTSIMWEDVKH